MELKGKLLVVQVDPNKWSSVSDFLRLGAPILYRELMARGVSLGTAGTVIDRDNFIVKFPIIRADPTNPELRRYIEENVGLGEVITSLAVIVGAIALMVTAPSLVRIFQSIGVTVKGVADAATEGIKVGSELVKAIQNPIVIAGVAFVVYMLARRRRV